MKKISVIVPVYNTEKYLRQCIDSILSYQNENLELIAVDDGSTDGSYDILSSYDDIRLKIFRKPNEGVYKTWQYGVKQATGDYTVFVDSDDYVASETFDEISKLLADNDYDLIQFGWYTCFAGSIKGTDDFFGLKEGEYRGEQLKVILKQHIHLCEGDRNQLFPVLRWGKVFRTDRLKALLPNLIDSMHMYEDDSMAIPYLAQITSLYILPSKLYYYRAVREGSMCNAFAKAELYYTDCKNICRFFEKNKEIFGFDGATLDTYYFHYHFVTMIFAVKAKNKKLANGILNDERMQKLIRTQTGLKVFLLKHKRYGAFRFLWKARAKLTGRF